MSRPAVAFVAWSGVEGRAREIAAAVGGEAACFYSLRGVPSFVVPLRWLHSAARMIVYLARRRPRALIVTNPPIFPGLIGVAYGRLARVPVVLDSHPGSFALKGDRVARVMLPVHRWLAPRVCAVLVTVEQLGERIRAWGGRPLIVHEAPAPLGQRDGEPRSGPFEVLFISTFDPDEPVAQVLQAAVMTPDVALKITGDTRRLSPELPSRAPANVRFVGYLGRADYEHALQSCDAVLALTTEPTSIMRAAYEAVYAQRPLVVSDWPALQETFPYAIHVENTGPAIAAGLERAKAERDPLSRVAALALDEQHRRWEQQLSALLSALPATKPSQATLETSQPQ